MRVRILLEVDVKDQPLGPAARDALGITVMTMANKIAISDGHDIQVIKDRESGDEGCVSTNSDREAGNFIPWSNMVKLL